MIEYRPRCRGVWLDRGELDKLVERDDDGWRDQVRPRERQRDHDDDDRERYPRKKKRGGLSDLFDFG